MISPVAGFSTGMPLAASSAPAAPSLVSGGCCSTVAICSPLLVSRVATKTTPTGVRRRAGRALLGDGERLDAGRLGRPVAGVGGNGLELLHHVHPIADLAEHRVLAVEPRTGIRRDDEELRAVRVRPGVGHRERAPDDLVGVDLVGERVAGAARAGTLRAAALDHEVLDDAVEAEPVVEAVGSQLAEVLDGVGSILVEQLEHDRPLRRLHRGGGHGDYLTCTRCRSREAPRNERPDSASITASASVAGTDTKENRSSTRTSRTASPSSPVEEVTAATMSATFNPVALPAPRRSFS